MSAAYRSVSPNATPAQPIVVAAPAGIADDDALIVFLVADNAAGGEVSYPAGFTKLTGTVVNLSVFDGATFGAGTKKAASESGSYSFDNGSEVAQIAVMVAVQGGDPAALINRTSVNSADSASAPTSAAFSTPTDAECTVVVGITWDKGGGPPTNSLAGYTKLGDYTDGDFYNLTVYYKNQVASGFTGVLSVTEGGSGAWAMAVVAVKSLVSSSAVAAYGKKKDRVPVPQVPGRRPGARGPFIPVQFRSTVNAALGTAGMSVDDVAQAHALDAVTLTVDTPLVVADGAQSQALDNVDLTQQNTLTAADVAQAQGLDALVLTQANTLVVQDVAQGQTLDPVTTSALLQTGGLGGFLVASPVPVRPGRGPWAGPFVQPQFQSTTNPTSGTIGLSANDIGQSQSLDNVALTQAGTLVVADIAQGHALDAVALVQANVLVVADLAQAHTLDAAGDLTQANTLAVADLAQAQSLDNVELSLAALLEIVDLIQSQGLESPALVQANVLAIAELLQGHTLDGGLTLTQAYLLAVVDVLQAQALDLVFFAERHPSQTETATARDLTWTAPRRN